MLTYLNFVIKITVLIVITDYSFDHVLNQQSKKKTHALRYPSS